MRHRIATLCRVVIALFFAVALTFGVSQLVSATNVSQCDTDPGTCENNDDCDEACFEEGMWPFGGECQMPEECCLCLM